MDIDVLVSGPATVPVSACSCRSNALASVTAYSWLYPTEDGGTLDLEASRYPFSRRALWLLCKREGALSPRPSWLIIAAAFPRRTLELLWATEMAASADDSTAPCASMLASACAR